MLFDKNSDCLKDLGAEAAEFAGLKFEEYKLKGTKAVSSVLSRFLGYFLMTVVLAIVLMLASYALLQWLNVVLGAPWGTLVVLGIFALLLLVLWLSRKALFVKLSMTLVPESEDIDDKISRAESESAARQEALLKGYRDYKSRSLPARLMAFVSGHPVIFETLIPSLLSIMGLFRRKRR